MMTNLKTDLKKTVMPLTYGFSWLQEVILYSKITKVSDMEGSFENDAVILLAKFFFHYSSHHQRAAYSKFEYSRQVF